MLTPQLSQLAHQRIALLNTSDLDTQQLESLSQAVALSDFIFEHLQKHSDWISEVMEALTQSDRHLHYAQMLSEQLVVARDEADFHRKLRQFRNRESVIIAWRDMFALCDVKTSLKQISQLAESLIMQSYHWLYEKQCEMSGTPLDQDDQPMPMLIMGMGKLGGHELNFSSDIDLIFSYPHKGKIDNGRKQVEFQQFFTRLGQKLINALHQQTGDGFVYRTDMRLRPFGDSGPLVLTFSALEDYYQSQGREWERFAMVKARILGEQNQHSRELQGLLKPFVFRRYLDFSAIDSLRKMKQLISQEIRRRGLKENIKLGAGGIREVEFIVQAFQLIRGGREPELQGKSLLEMLSTVCELGLLDKQYFIPMESAYLFLRRLEHCLQQIADKQTQTLPDNELDKLRVCAVMGFANYQALLDELERQMAVVHQQFNWLIESSEEEPELQENPFTEIWQGQFDQELVTDFLNSYTGQAEECSKLLHDFHSSIAKKNIGQRGGETLDKLFPEVMRQAFAFSQPEQLLKRVLPLFHQIIRRTTYLELLWEHPAAITQLLKLCAASPWIADYLAKYPILLDELLDPAQLYAATELAEYSALLQQFLLRIPEDDMEMQMDALRQFKQIHQLRIAAADVSGALPVMKVSDHLTVLAEVLCQQVQNLAWQQMCERYGQPATKQPGIADFAVVGYGKMGGIELGYGSDLDLVLLYGGDSKALTNGNKQIPASQFYVKMAQRMVHIFNARTSCGQLYEVDMRLRPSGDSGLLVSHIDSYRSYLLEDAWTWEHQALTRARVVSSGESMASQFLKIRDEVLCADRNSDELLTQVAEMREKMRDHLDQTAEDSFDIKQGIGGIADIEFITQYLLLANAKKHPEIIFWSDNIRSQELLAKFKLLTEHEAETLTKVYQQLRNFSHRQALANQSNSTGAEEMLESRQLVIDIWRRVFGN